MIWDRTSFVGLSWQLGSDEEKNAQKGNQGQYKIFQRGQNVQNTFLPSHYSELAEPYCYEAVQLFTTAAEIWDEEIGFGK